MLLDKNWVGYKSSVNKGLVVGETAFMTSNYGVILEGTADKTVRT